jgi:hypothetical protein
LWKFLGLETLVELSGHAHMPSVNMSAPSSSFDNGHDGDLVEKIEPALTHAKYYPTNDTADLTPAHRDYLLKKYGTLELDPVPNFDEADPYNWPSWKVRPLTASDIFTS